MADEMKNPRKFCDMTAAERFEDLRDRVNKYNMLQLPDQPLVTHMGIMYLIDDLWRELQKEKGDG